MRGKLVAAFLLLAAGSAPAQEIKTPNISFLRVEWDAVIAGLNKLDALKQVSASAAATTTADAATVDLIARLNRASAERFPTIAQSPVPVLLPFDVNAYLRDKTEHAAENQPDADYFSGFRASKFFLAGPGGYDAAFTVRPPDVAALSRVDFAGEVEIQISGMAFLYDLGDAVGAEPKPMAASLADFPGLRHVYLESHTRYLFMRYGVFYAVSIECYEGPSRSRRLSCRDADLIAVHFLKALTVAGGMPQPPSQPADARTIDRPEQRSAGFAYHAPGQLIAGTSARGRGGRADYTVYAKIRFPLAEAPAHTYSQVFMNRGDCNPGGQNPQTIRRAGSPFRCPPSDKVAEAGAPSSASYVYPWRDNFCETRGFFVGQCPGGVGHQGEDIVAVDCKLSSQDTDRCDRKLHGVVAAHDGAVLRSPGQEGLVIAVNAPNEHLRFRYLHMNPKAIDAEGFLSGRMLREGEAIGNVGNYSGREGGTSYHLHFDMQAPTKDGWVLVNPYMTLVSAYERLIGGRGEEIHEEEIKQAALAPEVETHVKPPARWKGRRAAQKHRVAARSKYKKYKSSKHCVRRRGC